MTGIEIPILIGLAAVVVAILERGYKSFLEKKAVDPKLKFDAAYLLNILITGGAMVVIVTVVIPAVITEVSANPDTALTLGSALLNFILGYAATYRILDGLNDSTKTRIEAKQAEE
ncbi:MAG TPA: hypothetical protein VL854_08045 [Nitrososphaeraceae archaeon]|nr:hypothetical protein [Nitrososphaeraceae archaeon]